MADPRAFDADPTSAGDTPGADPAPRPTDAAVLAGWIATFVAILGTFLTWGNESLFDRDRSAMEINREIYFDTTPSDFDASPIAVHLAVCFVLMLAALLVAKAPRYLLALGGAGVGLVAVLYLRGIGNVLSDPMYRIDGSITDHVGAGPFVCLVAGVVAVVAGLIPRRAA